MISINPRIDFITSLITPFKNNLEIDYNVLSDLITFQSDNEVDSLVLCGIMGEGGSLTLNEIIRIVENTRRNINSNLKIIVNIGRSSLRETLNLIEVIENLVDAFLIIPPFYYKLVDLRGLYNYFSKALDSVNRPVILGNVPEYTGIHINKDLIEKLLKYESFLGIMNSGGNLTNTQHLIETFPIKVFVRNDALLFQSFKIGAHGVISGLSNIINPVEVRQIIKDMEANDFDSAQRKKQQLTKILSIINEFPSIAVLKSILHWKELTSLKLRVRPPLIDLNNKQDIELFNKLGELI
ncbi:MAG: hypothetical protein GF329_22780 [Candidatus Lokiarchaeota archaeon]|nr:hypothetical protein [Candidatus Lokiarchaeota archaeon]